MIDSNKPLKKYTPLKKLQLFWYIVWRVLFITCYSILIVFMFYFGWDLIFEDPYRCTLGGFKLQKDDIRVQTRLLPIAAIAELIITG